MKDPYFQNERMMLLDYYEACIFLSHDDNGERSKSRDPKGIEPVMVDGVKKYWLSDLRAAC
jgi:hypothetical protein